MPGIERFEKEIPYEKILQAAQKVAEEHGLEMMLHKNVTISLRYKGEDAFVICNIPEDGGVSSFLYFSGSSRNEKSKATEGAILSRLHGEYGIGFSEWITKGERD